MGYVKSCRSVVASPQTLGTTSDPRRFLDLLGLREVPYVTSCIESDLSDVIGMVLY